MIAAINYYSISLFVGGFVAFLSGVIVYLNDRKNLTNVSWLLLNISSAVWSFGYFSMISAPSADIGKLSNSILHVGAIFIPLFYLLFVLGITGTYERYKKYVYGIIPLAIFFLFINTSPLFVKNVIPKFIFNYAPDAGPFYGTFTLYFFAINILGGLILLRAFLGAPTTDQRIQLREILFSSFAGFLGGGSVFFLTFNVQFPPYPLVLFTFYPLIIAYSIARHGLFHVRVIAAELLTFLLWIIILIRTLLSPTPSERAMNGGLLLATIVLGYFLIRSVIKEVKTREKIEVLAKDLETANARLKVLDQQKSEFVSLASHQLRSPLTAIKGYASMIMEGSFGAVDEKAKEATRRIFESSQHLASLVEDFLNITKIEQGGMKFVFAEVDLRKLAIDIIAELSPNASRAGLTVTFGDNGHKTYHVMADYEKIRQVVMNLIDNAVKYTPKGGSVTVFLSENDETGRVLLSVKDTGMGISPELAGRLFEKFSRGEGVSKVNTGGSGLGLYVAKEIVESHKGRIWAESDGVGKGSTFYMELNEYGHSKESERAAKFAKAL